MKDSSVFRRRQLKNPSLIAVSALMILGLASCNKPTSTSVDSTNPSTPASASVASSDSTLPSSSTSTSTSDSTTPEPDPYAKIVESEVTATGGKTGNLAAKGKFYTDFETKAEEQAYAKKVGIQIGAEGDVLLKNADAALPLRAAENRVTLFGIHSVELVTAGGGSGAGSLDGNGIAHSTLESSLTDAGFSVNPSTLNLYNAYKGTLTVAATQIDRELGMDAYSSSVKSSYFSYNDAAVVTISRIGAENKDLVTNTVVGHKNADDHYLQLDDNEVEMIKHVKQNFGKVIVLLNTPSSFQCPDLAADKTEDNLGVDAILWVGGVGNNAIDAVGQILNGNVSPSGHTVDLWSRDFTKEPSFTNFGFDTQNKDGDGNRMDALYHDKNGKPLEFAQAEYREGIYNGYKFYETAATDMGTSGEAWYQSNVLYPFGYGLSYTNFSWEWAGVEDNLTIAKANQTVTTRVKVTNNGNVAGKDVVEVYYSAPYTKGGIEKASNNFVKSAKTRLLEPGESQIVEVKFVAQDMASFDWNDANKNDFKGYELEAGNYVISANRNSHTPVLTTNRKIDATMKITTDYTTGKTIKPIFTGEYDSTSTTLKANLISRATGLVQPKASTLADRTLQDEEIAALRATYQYFHYQEATTDPWYVANKPTGWDQRKAAVTDYSSFIKLADMAGIDYKDMKIENGAVVCGSDEGSKKWETFMNQLSWKELCDMVAASSTGKSDAIGKGSDSESDGPVQIGGGYLFPSNPVLASTYNPDLAYTKGRLVGNEAMFKGQQCWRGPAMDNHRSPFSGRNFEYYSQDGNQGAMFANGEISGAVSKGLVTYTKHFFLNDSESYRADNGGIFTYATEQTIRETYLKTFEAACKAGAMGFMSSFNRIGKQVTANSYAVHQLLLRDEWDSKAVTETDAWAKAYVPVNKMAVSGDDELLGTSSGFADDQMDYGEWDETTGMVKTPKDETSQAAGTNDKADPTFYAGVRIRAQRLLFSRANSAVNKNTFQDGQIVTAVIERGLDSTVKLATDASNDIKVSIQTDKEGAALGALPTGLTLSSSGDVLTGKVDTEGTYDVPVNIVADRYVTVTGTLRIQVVSAMHLNGAVLDANKSIEIAANTDYTGKIETPTLAYDNKVTSIVHVWGMTMKGASFIMNEYYTEGKWWNRNEDQSAADIITTPVDDSNTTDPGYDKAIIYHYELAEGSTLPAGLSLKDHKISHQGHAHRGSYDVTDYVELTGKATTPGTYTFTINLIVPLTSSFGADWCMPSGNSMTYAQTMTVVVK
jgi:beta-glucosidase